MKIIKTKFKSFIKTAIAFLLNPRLLLCIAMAWMITNGWSYVAVALGTYFKIGWLSAIGTTYAGLLWFPFTPEKVVTVAIAIFLLRVIFPNDQKTLAILKEMQHTAKLKYQALLAHLSAKKKEKRQSHKSAEE